MHKLLCKRSLNLDLDFNYIGLHASGGEGYPARICLTVNYDDRVQSRLQEAGSASLQKTKGCWRHAAMI